MDARDVAHEALQRSGLSRTGLSARAGMSRAQLHAYLEGTKQPSLPQLHRLVAAAGLELRLTLAPLPAPEAFAAVLEFGDMFPRRERDPLPSMRAVWETARG